jgi:membrane protein implicated in regulation of membrane protease activity
MGGGVALMWSLILNSRPVRWAATIFVVVAGFLAALWRAEARGRSEQQARQEHANAAEYRRARQAADAAAAAGGDPVDRLRKHPGALRD